MAKRMLIDALHPEETRVAIADEKQIYDFDFVSATKNQLKGNIYLAKITRVEPSLQAAFVEYGGGKQGFLPFSEIHSDYYQIPVSDRKRLMQEAEQNTDEPSDAPTDAPSEETPAAEMAATVEGEMTSTDVPLAPAIEETPEITPEDENEKAQESPAYISQAATDISISEDAPLPEETQEQAPATADASDMASEQPTSIETAAESKGEEQPAQGESVETLQNEEEQIEQSRPKRNVFLRRYKIQEVIRRGQVVLVQVIKEERGNKGVSLTTYLSLAGRYCVLMPNSPKDGGISRKIASAEDRKRLKAISTELRLASGMSMIIRTAGMDRTRAEIKRDYDYLVKLWNSIREDTLKSNAPALIYEESDIIKRAIRDQYTNDIDEILIEGEEAFNSARDFMKLLLPSHTPRIKQYEEPTPLFYAYNIEDQLLSMHDPVVKLRSGGYIVINPTEALISIDVNSGRATGERNIEETAAKTNLEAAAEVARQLRLRDLAGLIVIDFIDMLESRNRRAVERALKDALKADRAKIQLGRISPFGLLEMSRQRLRPSISETNMVQCPHCVGRGYIRSNESMSIQMIRSLEKEASTGTWSGLRLIAPQAVGLHLLNNKRDALRVIEQRYGITIQVIIDPDLAISEFNLEKMRRGGSERNQPNDQRRGRRPERPRDSAPISAETVLEEMEPAPAEETAEITEVASEESRDSFSPAARRSRGRRRGGRGRRRDRDNNRDNNNVQTTTEPSANDNVVDNVVEMSPEETATPSGEDQRPPRNRERGGRGRRRWRNDREHGDNKNRVPRNNKNWDDNADGSNDVTKLPAFATEAPVMEPPKREPQVVNAPPVLESTPRDPNKPPRKGWWQKMIELDE